MPQKLSHLLSDSETVRGFWNPLGLWNLYFIGKFLLASVGYLNLDPVYNALLLAFLLVPTRVRWMNKCRHAAALVAAVALAYHESWLPGIDSITSNAANIAGFSTEFILELAWDFLNFKMIGWGLLLILAYILVKDWIRLSVFTVGYFLVFVMQPIVSDFFHEAAVEPVQSTGNTGMSTAKTTRAGTTDNDKLNQWLAAFNEYEKSRSAKLPAGISSKDTPFDIVFMNVCSLSNDDLEAVNLLSHPVFEQFDIKFDHFNSASSYSGPASLRLLNAACGQPTHDDLYSNRRPECEIMNRLGQLGFKQRLFMDHNGQYDNYLSTLRNKAGLTAAVESTRPYPVRYIGFDDEPIADTLAVLRHWRQAVRRDKSTKRSVTLFNFIALHDGNRLPRQSRPVEFKPRAQHFLDSLQTFMKELDRSGRKVMLIVVPEHGAALRGDRVQTARLRDIPSFHITEVPVMVKFFGLKKLPDNTVHVNGNSSYLALSDLIGRVIESNFFSNPSGTMPIPELVNGLPETNYLSENAQSIVMRYQDVDYIRTNDGKWKVYPK